MFFGAVHYALLSGVEHELSAFYPSIVGDPAQSPSEAAPAFLDFCAQHGDLLEDLICTRLVQTNAVRRSLGLKLAFASISRYVDQPVHLIDIGASAGINLRFDRFAYVLNKQRFGDPQSPVVLEAEWHGGDAIPDLDAIPTVASAVGVDHDPIDLTDPDGRRWLQALVWGDNRNEWDLLDAAVRVVAADPPELRAGDAIDVCPALAAELPAGEPRVVFHAATRMHVPAERLDAFDSAILSLGENAPLYWVDLERPPDPDPRPPGSPQGVGIYLRRPSLPDELVAIAEPRLHWVHPGAGLIAARDHPADPS